MITAGLRRRLTVTIMGFVTVIIAMLIISINLVPILSHSAQIENYMRTLVPDGGVMPPPLEVPPEDSAFHPEPPRLEDMEKFNIYDVIILTYSADGTLLRTDGNVDVFTPEELSALLLFTEESNASFGCRNGFWYLVEEVADGCRIAFLDDTFSFQERNIYIVFSMTAGILAWFLFLLFVLFLVRRLTAPVEDAFRKQKQFTADAGHELRTPLATIKANAEVLKSEYPGSREVSFILSEADRMAGLTEELVALAVIEDESRSRRRAELDLGRTVEAEALAFESLAFEHGITIFCDCKEGVLLKAAAADIRKLSSILISNAVKYGKQGGEIVVTVKEERHKGLIVVYNTGEGVSQEVLPHLFDRFYRLDSSRGGEGRSYGLGLSIAAAIVSDYDGTITAESSEGEWMRFCITLPLR